MIQRTYILIGALFAFVIAAPSAQAADTNNFTISDYQIEYMLSRDNNRRSLLVTTETITADFPNTDQNHGLERILPHRYDGHSTALEVTKVQNADGSDLEYTTDRQNGNTRLRIGDPDTYVHGTQTYVIQYTQRDVTRHFQNTGNDEFYWDTNGTDWRVPIARLSVKLTIDPALKSALTDNIACYQGRAGDTARCSLEQTSSALTTSAQSLPPGHNITIAVGFAANTFAAYEQPLGELLLMYWLKLQGMLIAVSVALIAWLSVRYYHWSHRSKELGTVVPEYLPPKDISVSTAATLLGKPNAFSAQLIDLAVRGYIAIHETKEKSFWRSAEYEIETKKDITSLRPEEQELLRDLYDKVPEVGERFALKSVSSSTAIYSRLSDNPKKLNDLIQGEYNLRHQVASQNQWFKRAATALLVAGLVLLSPPLLLAALIAFILKISLHPLTDTGLAHVRYLKGFEHYIAVAEAERLKMLQSPEGAEKTAIQGEPTPRQLVKLYEKALPYAVLFGKEKEWNKQLGRYYESAHTEPSWYSGAHGTAFSAAAFSSAMSSFTTTHSSSSTGGSTGGGVSGGGGGGGGGGGW